MGNIVGDKYRKFVNDQIVKRQEIQGSGLSIGNFKTEEEIIYLNSRNSWAKIASSVSVDKNRLNLFDSSGNDLTTHITSGKFLAQQYMLFNGFGGADILGKTSLDDENQIDSLSFGGNSRTSVEKFGLSPSYGQGNTSQFGFSPMPGIISISQKCLNMGSLKKTTVKLKAFNKYQFDIIDVLYLRLGFTVFIEFGFDKYYDVNNNYTSGVEVPSLIEKYWFKDKYDNSNYSEWNVLIEQSREDSGGNYEGIFGTISNFNWGFNDDGSYDIMFEVMSLGDVMESLKVNIPAVINTNDSNNITTQVVASKYITQRRERFKKDVVDELDFYGVLYPGLDKYLENFVNFARGVIVDKDNNIISKGNQLKNQPQPGSTHQDKVLFLFNRTKTEFKFNSQLRDDTMTYRYGSNIKNGLEGGSIYKWQNDDVFESYKIINEKLKEADESVINSIVNDGKQRDKKQIQDLIQNINPIIFINNNLHNAIQYALNKFLTIKGEDLDTFLKRVVFLSNGPLANLTPNILPLIIQRISFRSVNDDKTTEINTGISFSELKTYVYEYFKENNQAGGASDLQFLDPNALPTSNAIRGVKALLKGTQNRINFYFYKIREYESRVDKNSYPNQNVIYSKQIKVLEEIVGSCINPLSGQKVSTKDWNSTLEYPKYKDNNTNVDFVALTKFADKENAFYIRFGTFLEFLQDNVIPKISGKSKIPMVTIDTDIKTNICFTFDNIISLNPKKCIINNSNFYSKPNKSGKEESSYVSYFKGLNTFKQTTSGGKYVYGSIMNIYINFNRIEEILKGIDINGNISLFNVISALCDDINECFGNFTNLEPVIKEDVVKDSNQSDKLKEILKENPNKIFSGNTITILDQTAIPGIDIIKEEIGEIYTYEPTKLNVFGFNPTKNEGSFVKKLGLQTQITKDYASMISIGATANGQIPGTEATAFSNWNKGLTDRFKNELSVGGGENPTLKEQNAAVISYYKTFMGSGLEVTGLSRSGRGNISFTTQNFKRNTQIFRDFYLYAQAKINQDNGGVNTSIGFLPFNLSLELDGISGMHIYNKLSIQQSFLPSNYPETLQFIITGINHEVQDNNWITKLDTLATVYEGDTDKHSQILTPQVFGQEYSLNKPKATEKSYSPTPKNAKSEEYKGIKWYKAGGLIKSFSIKSKNIKILIDAMENEGIKNKENQCAILCVCAKESNFITFDEYSYKNTNAGNLGYLFPRRLGGYLKSKAGGNILNEKQYKIIKAGKATKKGDRKTSVSYQKANEFIGTGKNENPLFTKIKKDDKLFYDIIYGYIANQNGVHKFNTTKSNLWGYTAEQCRLNAQNNPNLSMPKYYGDLIAPGDGWMYRGRGFNHITFKKTYARYAWETGVDVLADPEILTNDLPKAALFSSKFFANCYKRIPYEEDKKQPNDPKTIIGDTEATKFESKERAIRWMTSVNGGGKLKSLNDGNLIKAMSYINIFEVV